MTYTLVLTIPLAPDEHGSKRNVRFESAGDYGDLDVAKLIAGEVANVTGLKVEVFQCRKVSLRHVCTF